MTPLRLAGALLLATTALSSCGSDTPDHPGVTPKSETLPTCADVWVKGRLLPEDYAGCVDGEGVIQVSEIKDCTSDAGRFTTYDEKYYAILGSKIGFGLNSVGYHQAYTACFTGDW